MSHFYIYCLIAGLGLICFYFYNKCSKPKNIQTTFLCEEQEKPKPKRRLKLSEPVLRIAEELSKYENWKCKFDTFYIKGEHYYINDKVKNFILFDQIDITDQFHRRKYTMDCDFLTNDEKWYLSIIVNTVFKSKKREYFEKIELINKIKHEEHMEKQRQETIDHFKKVDSRNISGYTDNTIS